MQFFIEVPVSEVNCEVVEYFTLVVALEICSDLFLVWFCDELYLYESMTGRLECSLSGSAIALRDRNLSTEGTLSRSPPNHWAWTCGEIVVNSSVSRQVYWIYKHWGPKGKKQSFSTCLVESLKVQLRAERTFCGGSQTQTTQEILIHERAVIALSSSEAEFYAASASGCDVSYFRNILAQLGLEQKQPTIVLEDNWACIHLSLNTVLHHKSKHIDVRVYHLRDLCKLGMTLLKIGTESMVADALTKPPPKPAFEAHCSVMMNLKK
eukprot:3941874-Rhodomonas_salina.1